MYGMFLVSGYANRSNIDDDYELWYNKKGLWLAPEVRRL